MGKGKMTKEIRNMLYNFYLDNLLKISRRGKTYALLLPEFESDRIRIDSYRKLRELMDENGFDSKDIFRMYTYGPVDKDGYHLGGYVFDLKLGAVRQFANTLAESFPNGKGRPLNTAYITRIKQQECQSLAKYCLEQFNLGERTVEVVLFNLGSVRLLNQQGVDHKTNSFMMLQRRGYALSPDNDIRIINSKLLIVSEIKIKEVKGLEVLPLKNGVRYALTLDSVAEDILRHINSEGLTEEV